MHMGARSFLTFPAAPTDPEFDKMLYAVAILTALAAFTVIGILFDIAHVSV